MNKTVDIEIAGDQFEEERKTLAAFYENDYDGSETCQMTDEELDQMEKEMDEADVQFDLMAIEAEDAWRKRYQPWEGMKLNGEQLYKDTETGEICHADGKPVNSCEALMIIDGAN